MSSVKGTLFVAVARHRRAHDEAVDLFAIAAVIMPVDAVTMFCVTCAGEKTDRPS